MNPWDFSNTLLSDRSGAHLARGIESAGASLARGIEDYRREKRRKEDEQAAIQFLKQNGARYGLDTTDDKELAAAIKATGGAPQAIQLFTHLDEQRQRAAMQQQQQRLVAAQLAQMEAAQAASARDAALLQQVQAPRPRTPAEGLYIARQPTTTPPLDETAVLDFIRRGGSQERAHGLLQNLEAAEKLRATRTPWQPTTVPLTDPATGQPVSAVMTSPRSAVPLSKPATAQPLGDTVPVKLGGRTLHYHPPSKRYFDAEGKPVDFSPQRPPRAPDPLTKDLDPELYDALRKEYLASRQPATATPLSSVENGPVTITTQAEFDRLTKGTTFIYNGRQGTKK